MHVVVVAHTRFALARPFAGGLESVTWHLVRALVARGHRVSVFAAAGSEPIDGVDYLEPETIELSEAARADVSMPDEGNLQRHHAYLALMLDLATRTDVDVVHVHALHYLPTAMAPTLRVPTVLTLHTPPTPWLESALQVAGRSAARGVGRMPHVTAVSAHTARAWRHAVEAEVVRNGVDTDEWTPGPGGDRLVWTGRITPEKAPHTAVEIARAAGMPLVLAGPLSDARYARERLMPMLGDGVEYAGHLHDTELVDLVGGSAAALVTPDWDEPYGLVAAEALACGTPVLGLSRGGLREIVRDEVGALVVPDDRLVGRAAAALPRVLEIPRERCRRYAEDHLGMAAMVDGYLEVYERALRVAEIA